MAARKKRPDASADAGASLVAWLILLTGAAVFGSVVYRNLTETPPAAPVAIAAEPEPTRAPREPASTPEPGPSPIATEPPVDLLAAVVTPTPAVTVATASRTANRSGRPAVGRLAIIIDDVGQDLGAARRAAQLPREVTFAIIPYLPHSRDAAELLHRRGFELMLHQPMEPISYPRDDPGRGAVLSAMAAADIRKIVLENLAAVPYVKGLNNHMGSRVTADRAAMHAVMQALVATPYFFIDSRTAEGSVAFAVARELGIPAAERTIFLDDTVSRAAIQREFERAVRLAQERGSAIAIGHPHALTLDLLLGELPRLSRRGLRIVRVSELVS